MKGSAGEDFAAHAQCHSCSALWLQSPTSARLPHRASSPLGVRALRLKGLLSLGAAFTSMHWPPPLRRGESTRKALGPALEAHVIQRPESC